MYVVIKRDGRQVQFDASKIEIAILKAMRYGSGIVNEELAKKMGMPADKIREVIGDNKVLGVLITHSHFDHIGALRNFLTKRSIKIFKRGFKKN